jgi:hypothetical protein
VDNLRATDVARALEQLALIARPLPVRSLRDDARAKALLRARLCYDHLAGRLGVALMDALLDQGLLAADGSPETYRLSGDGHERLAAFGVEVERLPRRRSTVRYCVDWGEQRHHLAGALGAAVTDRMFARGWLRRGEARRVVHLTDSGREGVASVFGMSVAEI